MKQTEIADKMEAIRRKHEAQFRSLFGFALRDYWDTLTGFDTFGFCLNLGCDAISLITVVRDRWGQAGVDVVNAIMFEVAEVRWGNG